MSLHPDLVYGMVRERQQQERSSAIVTTRARESQPRMQWRVATLLREWADRLDPESAANKRRAAETIIKQQLYYSRSLLAHYDARTGTASYEVNQAAKKAA